LTKESSADSELWSYVWPLKVANSSFGLSSVRAVYVVLAQPEVREFEVAAAVDQDVVGLDVTVDVVHLVHLLHSQHNLREVELALQLGESIPANQQVHEVCNRRKRQVREEPPPGRNSIPR